MVDKKNVIGIVVVVVLVLVAVALYYYREKIFGKMSKENFGMNPPMAIKPMRVMASSPQGAKMGSFYSVPGTYQGILSPRFANINYGAYLQSDMPEYKYQGVPSNPLTFGNMAKENYEVNDMPGLWDLNKPEFKPNFAAGNFNEQVRKVENKENYCSGSKLGPRIESTRQGNQRRNDSSVGVVGDGSIGSYDTLMPSNYAAGNFKETTNMSKNSHGNMQVTDMVPIGDATMMTPLGDSSQPIIYDRFIYSNGKNNRLRSQGDFVRGDLGVVPIPSCGNIMYRPSVNPATDLNPGAMNVMGGINNEQGKSIAALISAASGNTQTTIGGVNMSNQALMSLTGAQSEVNVTAYP